MRTLIVDCNNIAWTTRFSRLKVNVSKRSKDKNARSLIFFDSLKLIGRVAREFQCDSILLASDSKNLWRKTIYPDYKKKDNVDDDVYRDDTLGAANDISEFMSNYTASLVVSVENCEADDIISTYVNFILSDEDEAVILSSDRDYMQLVRNNVALYSHQQNAFRDSDNVDYDLFLKCMRGDKNDNIPSAYPRVRESRLMKAFTDDLEMLNLMETTMPDGRKVGDMYRFNKSLIDMNEIPEKIRNKIIERISDTVVGKYSNLEAMVGMKKFGINNQADALEEYSKAFRTTPKRLYK